MKKNGDNEKTSVRGWFKKKWYDKSLVEFEWVIVYLLMDGWCLVDVWMCFFFDTLISELTVYSSYAMQASIRSDKCVEINIHIFFVQKTRIYLCLPEILGCCWSKVTKLTEVICLYRWCKYRFTTVDGPHWWNFTLACFQVVKFDQCGANVFSVVLFHHCRAKVF